MSNFCPFSQFSPNGNEHNTIYNLVFDINFLVREAEENTGTGAEVITRAAEKEMVVTEAADAC